jgi:hypothetical protein
VRRALFTSFAISTGAKLALALCRSRRVALFVLYGPLSASAALGVPVLTIGVRRASHGAHRGAADGREHEQEDAELDQGKAAL